MNTIVKAPKTGNRELATSSNLTTPNFSSWVDNFFENGLGTGFLSNFNTGLTVPAVNISETANEFLLEIAVPGMKKSDFDIDIENKVLSISSNIQEAEPSQKQYTRREFGYSSFKRTFSLPETVESDHISANYKDGILEVQLPKKEEAKQKPKKRIKIA